MKYIITDRPHRIVAIDCPDDYEVAAPWIELNEEQIAFYLKHQSANPSEVLNLKMNEIDLDSYKSIRIQDIDRMSLQTSNQCIPEYKLGNANLTMVLLKEGCSNTIYSRQESEEILHKFNLISIACRNERYRVVALIEQAKTAEEVDIAVSTNKFTEL